MQAENLFGKAEPDARTTWLGSKEWNEYLIHHLRQYSLSVIRYLDRNPSSFIHKCLQLDTRIWPVFESVDRILDKVDKDLLD